MTFYVINIPICFLVFLFCSGCSDEDPIPPSPQRNKVVKSIVKPVSEEPKGPPASEAKDVESVVKTEGEPKGMLVAPEAQGPQTTEAVTKPVEERAGYYVVRPGDTLFKVAARKEVYGDSLMWLMVFRLNLDELGQLSLGADLPDRELPSGMRLKILGPAELKANLERRSNKAYVINVTSAATEERIVLDAVTLARKGYPVYATRFDLEGKEWVRLRVGFFENRAQADAVGKEIQKILNIGDTWSSKAGKNEVEEFGGF